MNWQSNTVLYVSNIVIELVYLYLFVKPLIISQGVLEMDEKGEIPGAGEIRNSFINIMVKYAIVSFIAVTTTLIAIILLMVEYNSVFIFVDNCFTCFAIILMSSVHSNSYNILCCLP